MIGILHEETLRTDIRQQRRKLELTQAQVGAECGVGGSTVAKWESGDLQLSLGRALQLCAIFDLNINVYYEVRQPATWQRVKLIEAEQVAAWRRQKWPADLSNKEIKIMVEQANSHGVDPVWGLSENEWNIIWRNKMAREQGTPEQQEPEPEYGDWDYSDQLQQDFLDDMENY